MIWWIASVPFWVVGLGLLCMILFTIAALIAKWNATTAKESSDAIMGIVVMCIVSGGFLYLAARIAS